MRWVEMGGVGRRKEGECVGGFWRSGEQAAAVSSIDCDRARLIPSEIKMRF